MSPFHGGFKSHPPHQSIHPTHLELDLPVQVAAIELVDLLVSILDQRDGVLRTHTRGQAHERLQKTGNEVLMMSRASVIFFFNDMVEEGVLEREEESGKGGYHGVYYPKMTRDEFSQYVVSAIIEKLKTL